MTEERQMKLIDPSKVKVGDLMFFIYPGKIKSRHISGLENELQVEGLCGAPSEFRVQGNSLIAGALSADYFSEEQKISMTKCAELLTTSWGNPFTVVFNKSNGEERSLRGRLIGAEPLLGRSHVEDLDKVAGDRIRLVDHRTLKSLILGGIKYVVGR